MTAANWFEQLDAAFEDLEDGDIDDVVRRIETATEGLAAHASPVVLEEVRERLTAALRNDDFFGRDTYVDILVRLAGADALPDILAACTVDLKDDRDGLISTLYELLEREPEMCRERILRAAANRNEALRREALHALTILLPAAGESEAALLAGLIDGEEETRVLVAECVIGSDWCTKLGPTIRIRAESDPSPAVRTAIKSALQRRDAD